MKFSVRILNVPLNVYICFKLQLHVLRNILVAHVYQYLDYFVLYKQNFQSEFNVYIGVKMHLLWNILVANLFLYLEYFVNYKQLIGMAIFVNSLFSLIFNFILTFVISRLGNYRMCIANKNIFSRNVKKVLRVFVVVVVVVFCFCC